MFLFLWCHITETVPTNKDLHPPPTRECGLIARVEQHLRPMQRKAEVRQELGDEVIRPWKGEGSELSLPQQYSVLGSVDGVQIHPVPLKRLQGVHCCSVLCARGARPKQ